MNKILSGDCVGNLSAFTKVFATLFRLQAEIESQKKWLESHFKAYTLKNIQVEQDIVQWLPVCVDRMLLFILLLSLSNMTRPHQVSNEVQREIIPALI